jgi:hypothetical protein
MESFKLNWYAFLIAFALGMAYVYFSVPTPKIIMKYPNPYNAGKVFYQDESKACYKYSSTKVECPKSSNDITPQPISIN